MGASFNKYNMHPKPPACLEALRCARWSVGPRVSSSLHTQRAAAGQTPAEGRVSRGPSAKRFSFNSPKCWPWKIALYGMWWGVNSISILTWVLSFSAPWLPVVPDNTNGTSRASVRLTRSSGEGRHQKTLQTHFSHGPLSCHLFFSSDNQSNKGWYWFKTSSTQLNYTLCDCSVKGVLIWKLVWEGSQFIPFLLKILGSWPKSTHCKFIQNVPKGEREEQAICNFSCAQRVKMQSI